MLIVHLFVSYAHVNLCHFFSSFWCRGLAAASACGSSWTFQFIFLVIAGDLNLLLIPMGPRCLTPGVAKRAGCVASPSSLAFSGFFGFFSHP